MIEEPRIVETTSQMAACIHIEVPRSEIEQVMQPGLRELMETLAEQGIEPTGPRFTHHLRMRPEVFDFNLCVPVEREIAAAGRVQPVLLEAARVARTVYHGPYEGLPEAWGELDAWIREQGLQVRSDLWERYLFGPEAGPDPAGWRTELTRPLAGG